MPNKRSLSDNMTPWVLEHVPRDQLVAPAGGRNRPNPLLPWQSFPATKLYALMGIAALLSASAALHLAQQLNIESYTIPLEPYKHGSFLASVARILWVVLLTPALSVLPCLALFVLFVYSHAHACSPSDRSGDCTQFVWFRSPLLQERYRGRRIDMETLYEMYFDGELDFIPHPNRDACDAVDRPNSVCLMREVLSRRSEFVQYTFGLTTHLRFLALQWVPDVLLHSKGQDVAQVFSTHVPLVHHLCLQGFIVCLKGFNHVFFQGFIVCLKGFNHVCLQVRDHYDRSKYYLQNVPQAAAAPTTPFTSDAAEDDFFGKFLGNAMVYTSGISPTLVAQQQKACAQDQQLQQSQSQNSVNAAVAAALLVGNEPLEAMQECKLKLLCRKMRMQKGDFHLDIGCGWGTLVNHAAAVHGTVGTGVTLSRNQTAYATVMSKRKRIRDHRTTFWCRDYRDIPTNVGVKYNKISCIEMAEHVGVKNFLTFLEQVFPSYGVVYVSVHASEEHVHAGAGPAGG